MTDYASEAEALRGSSSYSPPEDYADEAMRLRSASTPTPTAVAGKSLPWYESLIQGVKDPSNAAAQLILHSPIAQHVLHASQFVTSLGGLAPNQFSDTPGSLKASVDSSVQASEQEYQKERGDKGIDWWRAGGQLLNPINWVAPGGAPASAVARVGANAARGFVGAVGSQPVTENADTDFEGQKRLQGGVGGVGGAVLTPVANALARVVSPYVPDAVKTLIKSGVKPTTGQVLGGSAARLEEGATSIPMAGDFIKTAQAQSAASFNTAAYQRALDPVGEKAPTIVGREGVEHVAQVLGDKYDALLPKIKFAPDAQFASDLAGIRQLAAGLPETQQKQFLSIVKTQLDKAGPGGVMDGETLKGVMSTIRQEAKGYTGDPSWDNRKLGAALDEVHSVITQTLQRTNPDHAAELKAIDTGWANYARVRQAAAAQGAHDGVFTPAQLSAAVKAQDRSVGHGDFAKGNALMQDLSDAGKSVLGSKVPDSGTPFRSLMTNPISGSILGLGGSLITAPLYSKPGQMVSLAALTKRPANAPAIAEGVRRTVPALAGPTSGFFLRDLLNSP